MTPNALPEITEATLDPDTFASLVRDISECTTVHQVQLKGGSTDCGQDASELTVGQAAAMLQLGACHAIQVTYSYDGATWTDTLILGGEGVRLCRIGHTG